MATMIAIAMGGALGALARFATTNWLHQHNSFAPVPIGTLAVNVAGAFLLGLVLSLFPVRPAESAWVAAASVGFLGSFTTFSTLSWEAITLFRSGEARAALLYVVASLALGLTGTVFGIWVGQRMAR